MSRPPTTLTLRTWRIQVLPSLSPPDRPGATLTKVCSNSGERLALELLATSGLSRWPGMFASMVVPNYLALKWRSLWRSQSQKCHMLTSNNKLRTLCPPNEGFTSFSACGISGSDYSLILFSHTLLFSLNTLSVACSGWAFVQIGSDLLSFQWGPWPSYYYWKLSIHCILSY